MRVVRADRSTRAPTSGAPPAGVLPAMLNCWPMGFTPGHAGEGRQPSRGAGKPIDGGPQRTGWCTLERTGGGGAAFAPRVAVRARAGEAVGKRIVEERVRAPFPSIADLAGAGGLRRDGAGGVRRSRAGVGAGAGRRGLPRGGRPLASGSGVAGGGTPVRAGGARRRSAECQTRWLAW